MSVDSPAPALDKCRSCKADVIFVPSAKSGKPLILDAKPSKGVVLGRGVPFGHIPMQVANVVDVYTDHHVTCPNAADWKGRTRSS
ncbi:MAG: hypothetical protein ACRDH9_09240 [Actinomycetota bacterium]